MAFTREASAPSVVDVASYRSVRDLTESLAAPLSAEDQTVQSMDDVSPTKWHRAHTTWFFETFLLLPQLPDYESFHPDFGFLFNSYYEAVGSRHPRARRGVISRPGVSEIAAYRRYVDAAMERLLSREDLEPHVEQLAQLGLNHEQQHEELLLMDIKHVLAQNPLRPAYHSQPRPDASPWRPMGFHEHRGGLYEVGHADETFCFDNELPRHEVKLEAFAIADRPVNCGDFLAFIDDGGYERPELWLSDGWSTVRTNGWNAPLYWEQDREWSIFTLGGMFPIEASEPVCHISYYEADAYARWAGGRLPTEFEWEAACPKLGINHSFSPDWVHPTGAGRRPGGTGQVWEWTGSAYLPYPGFRPAPGAVGEYNGKFMVNQHVLRGGCVATPPGHLRASYRNFFPPGARWPFAGARIVRDLEIGSDR